VAKRGKDGFDPNDLVIEVDGEDVHLDTVDAARTLELAVAYMQLIQRIAEERDEEVVFTGFEAVEKCAALVTHPSDPELARLAAVEAGFLLSSHNRPPHGLKEAVERVRHARDSLPHHYDAHVHIRGLRRPIVGASEVVARSPYSVTSLRAQLTRVGGSRPRATFVSDSEERAFTVHIADVDLATHLAGWLYTELDIELQVARDLDGNIEDGVLTGFHPLVDFEDDEEWKKWFREAGIESLEELDRARKADSLAKGITRKGGKRGDGSE
jgi:hypothetical protein